MNRRNFLLGLIAGGAVVGTGGAIWLNTKSNARPLTIQAAIQTLDEMMSKKVTTLGDWKLNQILVHCAQSVEYSMIGYPEHKSDFFKGTVGPLAFAAFSSKGAMRHGLNEAIPGAPELEISYDMADAYKRFKTSMLTFANHQGSFADHFAYGPLTKPEYEQAHAMHFYNHLLEIEIAG